VSIYVITTKVKSKRSLNGFKNVHFINSITSPSLKTVKIDRVLLMSGIISKTTPDQFKTSITDFFKDSQEIEIGEVHIISKLKDGYSDVQVPKLSQNNQYEYKYAYVFDQELFPGFKSE
jgi:hypothetical protein